MIESEKLTPEEFGEKLGELGIKSTEDILPVIDKSQISDLPEETESGNWWIENFIAEKIDKSVELVGDFALEHYRDDKLVKTTKTPIYYSETKIN